MDVMQRGKARPFARKREKQWPRTRLYPAQKCGHITKKGRVYCNSCRDILYPKSKFNCMACGVEVDCCPSVVKKAKCCSMECRNKMVSLRQLGPKSHLWMGGVSSENAILRGSAQYEKWRKSVFARDDYTCVCCGKRGGKLTADHIKQWSLYPALRFDVENGRTMCRDCHAQTENFGGRALAEIKRRTKNGTLQYELI
jgi:hypothetical protein